MFVFPPSCVYIYRDSRLSIFSVEIPTRALSQLLLFARRLRQLRQSLVGAERHTVDARLSDRNEEAQSSAEKVKSG